MNKETVVLENNDMETFKKVLSRMSAPNCTGAYYVAENSKGEILVIDLSAKKFAGCKKRKFKMPSKELVAGYMPYADSLLDAVFFAYFCISISTSHRLAEFGVR